MLKAGMKLGNYEILKRLAAGSMGEVYLGRHTMLQTQVAIKVLLPHLAMLEQVRTRFAEEARAQSQLNHPGIVGVTDFIDEGEVMAFVMEYVDGPTLNQLLEERPGPWDPDDALAFMEMPLAAVAFAHRRGVVHRDIKPANIHLERTEDTGMQGLGKVADFGLTRVLTDETTSTALGGRLGTIPYMSPEQFTSKDNIDARSDVFALGMILSRMLTGRLPFPPDDLIEAATFYSGTTPLPAIEDCPPRMVSAIAAACSIDPSDRPADAGEFSAALGINVDMTISSAFSVATPSPSTAVDAEPIDEDAELTEDLTTAHGEAGEDDLDLPPPKSASQWIILAAVGLVAVMGVVGLLIAIGVYSWSSAEDEEATKAANASLQAENEARKMSKRAWTNLSQYKSDKSFHKMDSQLPNMALQDAKAAMGLHSDPATRAIHALSKVAASRWAQPATKWNPAIFETDLTVVQAAAADGTGEGKVAHALLLAHGCAISKHTRCDGVVPALQAARVALPTSPAWLDGELTWAEARYWATKAARHRKHRERREAKAAWSEVFEICEDDRVHERTLYATGPLTMNECVYAANANRRVEDWIVWVRWFIARDIKETGKFLPWVIGYASQSSSYRCSGMRTERDRNTHQKIPRIEDNTDALCATYGLVALGCLSHADGVYRQWSLWQSHGDKIRALSRASQEAPPTLRCYLDNEQHPASWFTP